MESISADRPVGSRSLSRAGSENAAERGLRINLEDRRIASRLLRPATTAADGLASKTAIVWTDQRFHWLEGPSRFVTPGRWLALRVFPTVRLSVADAPRRVARGQHQLFGSLPLSEM
jgi:hypothetical protein